VIIFFRVLENLLSHITSLLLLNWINNLGGALFGFIRGAIIIGLLLFFLNIISMPPEIENQINQSILAGYFLNGLVIVYNAIAEWLPGHFQLDINILQKG